MKILFLDDDVTRHKRYRMAHIGMDITYAWTAAEAIQHLTDTVFDRVSLDHDLAEDLVNQLPVSNSGYDVAMYIAAMPEERRPKVVVIHSFNPAGARRMWQALRDCTDVHIIRFAY